MEFDTAKTSKGGEGQGREPACNMSYAMRACVASVKGANEVALSSRSWLVYVVVSIIVMAEEDDKHDSASRRIGQGGMQGQGKLRQCVDASKVSVSYLA